MFWTGCSLLLEVLFHIGVQLIPSIPSSLGLNFNFLNDNKMNHSPTLHLPIPDLIYPALLCSFSKHLPHYRSFTGEVPNHAFKGKILVISVITVERRYLLSQTRYIVPTYFSAIIHLGSQNILSKINITLKMYIYSLFWPSSVLWFSILFNFRDNIS